MVEKRFIVYVKPPIYVTCYLGVRAAMPSNTTAAQRPQQQTEQDMGSQ